MDQKPGRPDDFPENQTFRFDKEPFDAAKTHQDWHRLRQRIQAGGKTRALRGGIRWIGRYKIAAAAILFLAITSGIILLKDLIGRRTYATDFGERREVRLPDGSVVTLNANSRLYFHDDWGKKPVREVWLEGEAFFKVKEQIDRGGKVKFVVHTGKLNVEVLGTQFNVKKRGSQTRVTLTSGRVRIAMQGDRHQDIIMNPGEQIAFSASSEKIEKRTVETRKYTAWTKGKLILDHKTLAELAEIIQETYGKTVVFEDEQLKSITLSGSYPLDDMENLLHALEMSAQITITYDNEEIILKK